MLKLSYVLFAVMFLHCSTLLFVLKLYVFRGVLLRALLSVFKEIPDHIYSYTFSCPVQPQSDLSSSTCTVGVHGAFHFPHADLSWWSGGLK